jgi:hypothetical protein
VSVIAYGFCCLKTFAWISLCASITDNETNPDYLALFL